MIPWHLIGLSFVAEYVDSALGMGYGTVLTPILLLLGYPPGQVVPTVLLAELGTGFLAAGWHHGLRNVNLRWGSPDLTVAGVLGAMSVLGAVAAVVTTVSLPAPAVKLYIAAMVTAMGIAILVRRAREWRFSWPRLLAIGAIAAFNKGISGGGYGPLVTAGQILSGVGAKNAVGITSLAEGLTCLVGVMAYLFLQPPESWTMAPPLVLGAILSVPLAALTVKRAPERGVALAVGAAVLGIGVLSLVRAVG
ncbi:MAG: sulfite exporter TauE/SafE family protein [Candidatus Acetothermia bacterium]|jgi:uncharacterized membrane protein YfcA|nr:sulfite exporter TauE/SafE family protein [Candidatus Acetothermia bacterium]